MTIDMQSEGQNGQRSGTALALELGRGHGILPELEPRVTNERPPLPPVPESQLTSQLARLRQAQEQHPFWDNRLLRACAAGELSKADFQFIFSQYYLYSKNFTRYLAAFMANCDSDHHRARLAENLWEEGGMETPENRHAEIFRRFLCEALDIDLTELRFLDSTRYFVREYLHFCAASNVVAGAAFLSLGTEAIVARLYSILMDGLERVGVEREQLHFFQIHIECDDGHAETLEQIMLAYAGVPGWYETCREALQRALGLREHFFEELYERLQLRRLSRTLERIQARQSLVPQQAGIASLSSRLGSARNVRLYDNVNQRLNIDFSVERVPFRAEVLDLRLLRIAPGKSNELHRHPHESLFYVIEGRGTLRIDDSSLALEAGDIAFVPRWAMHQTNNVTDGDLVILAVTDFALTERALAGNQVRTTRMKGTEAALPGE